MSLEPRELLVRRARRSRRGLPGARAASQALVLRAVGKPDRVAGEGKPDSECSNPPGGPSGRAACLWACRAALSLPQASKPLQPGRQERASGHGSLRGGPPWPPLRSLDAACSRSPGPQLRPVWRGHRPSEDAVAPGPHPLPSPASAPGPGQGRRTRPTPLVPAVALPPEKAEGREGPGQLFGTDDGERAVNREGPRGPGKRRLNVDVGLRPAAPPAGGQRRGRARIALTRGPCALQLPRGRLCWVEVSPCPRPELASVAPSNSGDLSGTSASTTEVIQESTVQTSQLPSPPGVGVRAPARGRG